MAHDDGYQGKFILTREYDRDKNMTDLSSSEPVTLTSNQVHTLTYIPLTFTLNEILHSTYTFTSLLSVYYIFFV